MSSDPSQWPVWANEPVLIVDYLEDWPSKFALLVKELNELYSFDSNNYEHVGSTAVPGMCAKPIIDIILPVETFKEIPQITSSLKCKDWNLIPPELDNHPTRRLFVKVVDDKRYAHFSLILNMSDELMGLVAFRNILRNNPIIFDEYAVLKRELRSRFQNNREAYTDSKSHFIRNSLIKK